MTVISPASVETRAPGSIVGERYRIVRLIGAGGMGGVYEAEHTWTGRRVALKLLYPEVTTNEEAVARFMQEARTATAIAHPNIVEVLDMGRDADGSLFIAQELLDGEDLAARLKREGPLPVAVALDLVVPILGALAAAHGRGVVHRDVKPGNIFLAQPKENTGSTRIVPKLIDFGISKVAPPPGHAAAAEPVKQGPVVKTRTGQVIGTAAYMSPEQVRAEPIDGATDVWAVAVVLYEMIAGKGPFDAANYYGAVFRVLSETPRRLDEVVPGVPRALADAVARALDRDRAARPDVRAFLDALLALPAAGTPLAEKHRQSLATPDVPEEVLRAREKALALDQARAARLGTPASVPAAPAPTPAQVPTAAPTQVPAAAPAPSRKPPWVLVAAVVAALIGLAIFLVLRR